MDEDEFKRLLFTLRDAATCEICRGFNVTVSIRPFGVGDTYKQPYSLRAVCWYCWFKGVAASHNEQEIRQTQACVVTERRIW